MPSVSDWEIAGRRAGELFGVIGHPYLTAPAVAGLTAAVRIKAGEDMDAATALVGQLETAYGRLGLNASSVTSGRIVTARAAATLVDQLRKADGIHLIQLLTGAQLPATDSAVGKSLASAVEIAAALRSYRWERFSPLIEAAGDEDARAISAENAVSALRNTLAADEIVSKLKPALVASEDAAFGWLREAAPRPPVYPIPDPDKVVIVVPPHVPHGHGIRVAGGSADMVLEELSQFLVEHKDDPVVVEWRVQE